jgi:micrococcal nuclease
MYEYQASLVRCVDGDTVDLEIDLGFNIRIRERFRISGIDTPELNSSNPLERVAAKDATAYLSALLGSGLLMVKTEKDKREKYGRYLCTIKMPDGHDVSDEMIKAGHARAYDGGTRMPWIG